MAKKKAISQKTASKIKIKKANKSSNKIKLKECFIKLDRIDHLISRVEGGKKFEYTQHFDIQIKGGTLKINSHSINESPGRVFNINMKIKSDRIVVMPCGKSGKSTIAHSSALTQLISEQCQIIKKPPIQIAKTLNQLIDEAWRELKKEKKRNKVVLVEDEPVMAKMSGFPAWPARIISFTKNRKGTTTYFYGTHNAGPVPEDQIVQFDGAQNIIRLLLLRRLDGFAKGVREIEIEKNVPIEMSITNDQLSLQ